MHIDNSILIASLLFTGLVIGSSNMGYRAEKLYQSGLVQHQLLALASDDGCGTQSEPPRCGQSDPPGSGRRE